MDKFKPSNERRESFPNDPIAAVFFFPSQKRQFHLTRSCHFELGSWGSSYVVERIGRTSAPWFRTEWFD